MSQFAPGDVPVKTAFGAAKKDAAAANIPPHLYQLLILVNGSRTVEALLRFGISGVDLSSFDTLHQLKLIEHSAGSLAKKAVVSPSGKGLSEARFAVLDILLDISEKDLGVRPWIEKIERVDNLARLSAEIEAFCASPFGRKYLQLHNTLRQAAAL